MSRALLNTSANLFEFLYGGVERRFALATGLTPGAYRKRFRIPAFARH